MKRQLLLNYCVLIAWVFAGGGCGQAKTDRKTGSTALKSEKPVEDETNSKQKNSKPPALLKETHDEFFGLPWLTSKNVDECVKEINDRGIRRIRLEGVHGRTSPELLRRIRVGCPDLTALSISDWTFTITEFEEFLNGLPELTELRLRGCRLTAKEGRDNQLQISDSETMRLTVQYCPGVDDRIMTTLLSSMPRLEELTVSAARWRGDIFNGEGWPVERFAELKKFSGSDSNEHLVRKVLSSSPNLRSLHLPYCEDLTGSDWKFASDNIEELDLTGCKQISDEAAQAILLQTPHLKVLSLGRAGLTGGGKLDLSHLVELRCLSVRQNRLNCDFVIRALDSLTDLEELTLFCASPTEEPEFDLGTLTRLKSLKIGASWVPTSAIATIPSTVELVEIRDCWLANSSIAALLKRLPELRSLKLTSIHGGRGYADDPEALTGIGWDFTAQKELLDLDLSGCYYITDELMDRIATNAPAVESLKLWKNEQLTGRSWLARFENLKSLDISEMVQMENDSFLNLPKSLESVRINGCNKLTGRGWNLAPLVNLTNLEIQRCGALTSIGAKLPASLSRLRVQECVTLKCSDLDYSSFANFEDVSFRDCYEFDVDRLFAGLPGHAQALRRLNLTGCPNVTPGEWDMSPLGKTLYEFIYPEAEPAYVGGIDEVNWMRLTQQLPDVKIVR